MSANSKSLHGGHSFSPLTRGTDLDDPKSEIGHRVVATRSTRQPRLSFAAFAPSSENDHPKKLKPEEKKEQVPVSAEEEAEEEAKRTWNLRPRNKGNGGDACGGGGGGTSEVKNQKSVIEPKSNRQRGIPADSPGLGGVEVGNENHRLWIALSRDEIEEDLFSMSGNRPSRRPRKRTKTLQKYLDVISPGLCLVGMNADCFRVSNSPAKVRTLALLIDFTYLLH
ncbi:unnamed protein product [Arabis nemorensis]|uniref:Uncharacterized protein n=1 Tax=Arabis nemorensis TaxID=586526 RepID=A0A565CGH7_9BRAS|nr:unnamed protein product [Arabis nemorensis]